MNQRPQPDLPNGEIKDWDLRPCILNILAPEPGGNLDVTGFLTVMFCPCFHTGVYSSALVSLVHPLGWLGLPAKWAQHYHWL